MEATISHRDAELYFAGLRQRIAKALRKPAEVRKLEQEQRHLPKASRAEDEDALVAWGVEGLLDAILGMAKDWHLPRSKQIVSAIDDRAVDQVRRAIRMLKTTQQKLTDHVSPKFHAVTEEEVERLTNWIDGVTKWGNKTRRENFDYDAAGYFAMVCLKDSGVSYAAVEAVHILWHSGYSELDGVIDVLNPYKRYSTSSGKDPRDPLRRAAEDRWHRHRDLIEKHPRLDPDVYQPQRPPSQDWEDTE